MSLRARASLLRQAAALDATAGALEVGLASAIAAEYAAALADLELAVIRANAQIAAARAVQAEALAAAARLRKESRS